MMVEGAEERQPKGPIDVLAPYTSNRSFQSRPYECSRNRTAP
jgi:hypothetical protein